MILQQHRRHSKKTYQQHQTFQNFYLSAVDYSYTIDLSQAAGDIQNDYIIGASQLDYGAYLSKNGTQSKIQIRKITNFLSFSFIYFNIYFIFYFFQEIEYQ